MEDYLAAIALGQAANDSLPWLKSTQLQRFTLGGVSSELLSCSLVFLGIRTTEQMWSWLSSFEFWWEETYCPGSWIFRKASWGGNVKPIPLFSDNWVWDGMWKEELLFTTQKILMFLLFMVSLPSRVSIESESSTRKHLHGPEGLSGDACRF